MVEALDRAGLLISNELNVDHKAALWYDSNAEILFIIIPYI